MALFDNSNGITELYSTYKPAFNNLYEVEICCTHNPNLSEDIAGYIKFHAPVITFEGEALNLERNSVTKNFQLVESGAFTRSSSLSITWREDESWKVKEYHDAWLACFYDKKNDNYISYPVENDLKINNYYFNDDKTKPLSLKDIYRTIKIKMPYNNKKLVFNNVLPNTAPGVSLGWSTGGDIVTHQITYYVRDWKWE